MKNYKIETCAFGEYYAGVDPKCPLGWRGSGCYDIYRECWQEATFSVSAESLANALKIIGEKYEKMNLWSNSVSAIYYDPAVSVTDDDGEGEEITEWTVLQPVDGPDTDAPERYSVEI